MRRRLILQIFALLVVIIMTTGYFIYNKPHRNVLIEEAQFSMALVDMNNEFLIDEEAANSKYLNQVVEISGIAVGIDKKANDNYDVMINSRGILATGELINIDVNPEKLINKEVVLKGLFIGFDNLLEEIKLRECSIKPLGTN